MRYILIALIFFSACRCPQPITNTTTVHDSVYVERHSVDTLYLPSETATTIMDLYAYRNFNCDTLVFKKEVKNKHVTSSLVVKNGFVIATCKADSLQLIIDSLVLVKQRKEVQSNIIREQYKSGFDKITNYFFWVAVGAIVLLITLKLLKYV